jgi:hypothetical protein
MKSDLHTKRLPELEEEGKEAFWLLLLMPQKQRDLTVLLL